MRYINIQLNIRDRDVLQLHLSQDYVLLVESTEIMLILFRNLGSGRFNINYVRGSQFTFIWNLLYKYCDIL